MLSKRGSSRALKSPLQHLSRFRCQGMSSGRAHRRWAFCRLGSASGPAYRRSRGGDRLPRVRWQRRVAAPTSSSSASTIPAAATMTTTLSAPRSGLLQPAKALRKLPNLSILPGRNDGTTDRIVNGCITSTSDRWALVPRSSPAWSRASVIFGQSVSVIRNGASLPRSFTVLTKPSLS